MNKVKSKLSSLHFQEIGTLWQGCVQLKKHNIRLEQILQKEILRKKVYRRHTNSNRVRSANSNKVASVITLHLGLCDILVHVVHLPLLLKGGTTASRD